MHQTLYKGLKLALISLFFPSVLLATNIKNGNWRIEFQIKENKILPINLVVKKKKKTYQFFFKNGKEEIHAKEYEFKGDSLYIKMPIFNSEFKLKINSKKELSGNWYNYTKGPNYAIPVRFKAKINDRFQEGSQPTFKIGGKWRVKFNYEDSHPWDAVGVFSESNDQVEGTFLTETGDYRFLEGNVVDNKMQVSCFDGSHAFLFEAEYNNDTLKGTFYSGNHWSCNWYAVKDDQFELKNANELTYIKANEKFTFTALDSTGKAFHFPNDQYQNKVTIIQIMGSWCPNCMDETVFYKQLYKEYNQQGLEIISVGFEAGSTNEIRMAQLDRLKKHFNINYPVLLGGKADKKIANDVFTSLNHVMSFPTSIFIDKNGDVRKIHTGFNGPGTGSYYTNYVEQTKMFIEELINE